MPSADWWRDRRQQPISRLFSLNISVSGWWLLLLVSIFRNAKGTGANPPESRFALGDTSVLENRRVTGVNGLPYIWRHAGESLSMLSFPSMLDKSGLALVWKHLSVSSVQRVHNAYRWIALLLNVNKWNQKKKNKSNFLWENINKLRNKERNNEEICLHQGLRHRTDEPRASLGRI